VIAGHYEVWHNFLRCPSSWAQGAECKRHRGRAAKSPACAAICSRPLATRWFQRRRDVRVVEGARLENDCGDSRQAIL